jgi:hypothetical protein
MLDRLLSAYHRAAVRFEKEEGEPALFRLALESDAGLRMFSH